MNHIVTVHSFRQSVGKSTLAANLATLLTLQGRRVGLVDTDFQGASAHLFFGLKDDDMVSSFNDYLWQKCDILKTVHDITGRLDASTDGKLFLVPASSRISDIIKMLRTSMNIERYTEGLDILEKELALDILLVDTRAGLNEYTLTAMAISNTLVLVLRPDRQDIQGTAVTVEVAKKLMVPSIQMVLNDSSQSINEEEIKQQLEESYHCGGGFVLNHAEELLALASGQPFVLAYPEHPLTERFKQVANVL
jgi:septum site-determining protein MinD